MEETSPTRKRLALGLSAVLGAAGLYVALPASAQTPEDPLVVSIAETANQTCADFAAQYGGGQTWIEVKFPENGDAPVDETRAGITIDVSDDGKSFTWTSTNGIDAVFAKSGAQGSNLYVYAATAESPEAFSGKGSTSQDLSHVSFCYDESNPTTSTTSSTSTTSTTAPTTDTTAPTTDTTAPTTDTTAPAEAKAPVAPAAQPVVAQPTYTG